MSTHFTKSDFLEFIKYVCADLGIDYKAISFRFVASIDQRGANKMGKNLRFVGRMTAYKDGTFLVKIVNSDTFHETRLTIAHELRHVAQVVRGTHSLKNRPENKDSYLADAAEIDADNYAISAVAKYDRYIRK